MPARNLIVARVGRNSLHRTWLGPSAPGATKAFDLVLCPYEPIDDPAAGPVIPGPKWAGLRELLNTWDGWRDYDYVWLPDDDIAADPSTLARMFEVAHALELSLFAPALREDSYFAHFSTMRNASFSGRWVGFVEIMMPGFSSRALAERLLPTLDLSETGWGWGLDPLWAKLLGYEDVAIIDGTPVLHTRPVGSMRDSDLGRRVVEEGDAIMAAHDSPLTHRTFGAFGPDLAPLDLDPQSLLHELVRGYGYLIERDARVLSWIHDFQTPPFRSPHYPGPGVPSGPRALR